MTTIKKLPYSSHSVLPSDVQRSIREMKVKWRESIGDVPALMATIMADLENEIEDIERSQAQGKSVWPEITYEQIHRQTVPESITALIKKRGCAVIRGHFSPEQAQQWDEALVEYVEINDFDNQYRGPGDDFFGTLSASRPEIFPIYWSPSQMEARQSPRMHEVQCFLNGFWKVESEGRRWFDPAVSYIYPDRVRRRPPGTTSNGLGPHTDSGALERWLLPAYQRVFRHILAGQWLSARSGICPASCNPPYPCKRRQKLPPGQSRPDLDAWCGSGCPLVDPADQSVDTDNRGRGLYPSVPPAG
nr:YbiU family protein [uncultured Paraglaciecola sp.]